MTRFWVTLFFYVIVARWFYSEANLLTPSLVPFIDMGLEKVKLPTHDTWDEKIQFLVGDSRQQRHESEVSGDWFTNDDSGSEGTVRRNKDSRNAVYDKVWSLFQ